MDSQHITFSSLPHRHESGVNCLACEALRATSTMLNSTLPFAEASKIWLDTHSLYIKPSTLRVYEQRRKVLAEFFKDLPLDQLHIGNLRGYQRWRMEKVSAAVINGEINTVLAPMLAEVDRWKFFLRVYKPLPVPPTRIRQSMSEDEMRRLITIALDNSKPRRLLAGHCLLVMANTGTGFGELKHLRRDDVVLNAEVPYVTINEGLKNPYRQRIVPLNWISLRSMRWLIHRWEDLGGIGPTEYILPHMARHSESERRNRICHSRKTQPIFTEPMLTIWNAARKILNEAGLAHMDIYDCRSHFATKIMENPDVSEMEAGEWIGHGKVAREMNRRYFAPKMKKMVKAVEKVAVDPEPTLKLIAFPGRKN